MLGVLSALAAERRSLGGATALPEGTAALRPTDCSAAGRIRSGPRWLAGWRAVASGDAQSRAHRAVVIG